MRLLVRTPWLLMLMLLVGLASSAGAQAPGYTQASGSLVVPGSAIGNLSLDMAVSDYYWRFGPTTVNLSGAGPLFRPTVVAEAWSDPPVMMVYRPGDNVLLALGSTDDGAMTRERIGMGATEDKVTKAYGSPSAVVQIPSRPKILIYDVLGLAFQIAFDTAQGKYTTVERVFVFRPGHGGAIWRTQ